MAVGSWQKGFRSSSLRVLYSSKNKQSLLLLIASITSLAWVYTSMFGRVHQPDHLLLPGRQLPKCSTNDRPLLKVVDLPLGPVPPNAIHFIISGGTRRITPREICSIESAATLHPDSPVVISLLSPHLEWTLELDKLQSAHRNVSFLQLDLKDRLSGTPLGGKWLDSGLLFANPEFKINYISDVVRMATLYKYGGAYLDTDILMLKPIMALQNTLTVEGNGSLANANFIAFNKGHRFLLDVMLFLKDNFRTDDYNFNGPQAVTKTLVQKDWCHMDKSGVLVTCKRGITLLPAEAINPIDYRVAEELLMSNEPAFTGMVNALTKESYALHMYNARTKHVCIELNPGMQPIVTLVKRACPKLVEQISGDGGRF